MKLWYKYNSVIDEFEPCEMPIVFRNQTGFGIVINYVIGIIVSTPTHDYKYKKNWNREIIVLLTFVTRLQFFVLTY